MTGGEAAAAERIAHLEVRVHRLEAVLENHYHNTEGVPYTFWPSHWAQLVRNVLASYVPTADPELPDRSAREAARDPDGVGQGGIDAGWYER